MSIFGFVSRALGSLRPLTDDDLQDERESVRERYVTSGDVAQADRLFNELHRYDAGMRCRVDRLSECEQPDATSGHREHGWYLPIDN